MNLVFPYHTEYLCEVTNVKLARQSECFASRIWYDTENVASHKDSLHKAVTMSFFRDIIKGYVVLQLRWVHLHWVMYLRGLLQLELNYRLHLESQIGHG